MVEWLFLAVPRGCLRFVIVVFPDHTEYFCGRLLGKASVVVVVRVVFCHFTKYVLVDIRIKGEAGAVLHV